MLVGILPCKQFKISLLFCSKDNKLLFVSHHLELTKSLPPIGSLDVQGGPMGLQQILPACVCDALLTTSGLSARKVLQVLPMLHSAGAHLSQVPQLSEIYFCR